MPEQPHILILMTDQHRADCLSCAGHPVVETPNLDRLAAEGVRFTQATTTTPVCMPARASFVNGLYPHNHGMWFNSGRMPADDETFFHLLQGAGYYTAYIGKSHYYPHRDGAHLRDDEPYMHRRGLEYVHETTGPLATVRTGSYMTDEWEEHGHWELYRQDYATRNPSVVRPSPLPVEAFPDSYVGRKAMEFVHHYDAERPVCLFVGFGGPHDPWDAPGEYATCYSPGDCPEPIPVPDKPDWLPAHVRESPVFLPQAERVLAQAKAIRANYYGKIALIDRWCGAILNAFAARGWLNDLLVVFWSDHGEMACDHGRIQKTTFHEASVRVPLIVRWPGRVPEGLVSASLVEIIDIFPTLVEAAGAEPSRRCVGRSLWPVVQNPKRQLRDYQLSEIAFQGRDRHLMIRSHEHKYVVDQHARPLMLYDLSKDPTEQVNLVGKPGTETLESELREALLRRLLQAQYTMR